MKRKTEYMALPFFIKAIDQRTVKQIFAVMGNRDNGNDIIHPGAFTKTLRERFDMVQVLWQHQGFEPPIGVPHVVKEIGKEDLPSEVLRDAPDATGALYGEIEYLDTPRGNEVLVGIQKRAIKKNSIGYIAVKADYTTLDGDSVRNLREVMLMDVSPVNWAMNEATTNMKAALPFADRGKADLKTPFAVKSIDDYLRGMGDMEYDALPLNEKRRVEEHFAWALDGELWMPHHLAQKQGVGPAVWEGVKHAMLELMDAACDIPEADRKDVYAHLAGHYEQFEQTPPEFGFVEACYHAAKMTAVIPDLKEGRVLSAASREKVTNAVEAMGAAMSALQTLLDASEPSKAMSRGYFERKLRLMEAQFRFGAFSNW